MSRFVCPNCNKHSNQFVIKCPDCGYTRLEGTKISINNSKAKTARDLKKENKLMDDKFRGGRNASFIGGFGNNQTPRNPNSK